MRIGQIGVRVDFFWTTIDNESELLQRFGIVKLPFDMTDFLKAVKIRIGENRNRYVEELKEYGDLFIDHSIPEGPYIHHCSAVYDRCGDVLEDACKYIPGLKTQRFERH